MRKLTVFVTILFALAPASDHAQEGQRPGTAFRASVDLIVVNVVALDRRGQPVAAHLDLYPSDASSGAVSATLEIAEGDAAPPLSTAPLSIENGEQPDWRTASGASQRTFCQAATSRASQSAAGHRRWRS